MTESNGTIRSDQAVDLLFKPEAASEHARPVSGSTEPMSESPKPSKPRRRVVLSYVTRAVVAIVVVVVGVGIFKALEASKPRPPAPDLNALRPIVRVAHLGETSVRRQWRGFGTAAAMDTADVPAEVTALVRYVPESAEPGTLVQAGDVLATLDPSDFDERLTVLAQQWSDLEAQLEQLDVEESGWRRRLEAATDELAIAERDFDRVKELFDRSDAKQVELDRAMQAVRAAERLVAATSEEFDKVSPRRLRLEAQKRGVEAEQRIAQRNIDRCTIVVPLDGVIQSIDVEVGEQVSPGRRVARIVSLRRIEVPLRLQASARRDVRIGDAVRLRSAGQVDGEWLGTIERVSPLDDESTRTFAVYVVIEQSSDTSAPLTPGRYVEGIVSSATSERRFVVPRSAISNDRLRVVHGGELRVEAIDVAYYIDAHFVEFGLDREQYWAALKRPLPDDTFVVLAGSAEVPDGTIVDVDIMNDASTVGRGQTP